MRRIHRGGEGKLGVGAASGQRPVREVLWDYSTQMQQILDRYKGT